MSRLTPIDELLSKFDRKIPQGLLTTESSSIPPAPVPNAVDKLMQELDAALLAGETSIKKTRYLLELTKEEAIELRDHLIKELGIK